MVNGNTDEWWTLLPPSHTSQSEKTNSSIASPKVCENTKTMHQRKWSQKIYTEHPSPWLNIIESNTVLTAGWLSARCRSKSKMFCFSQPISSVNSFINTDWWQSLCRNEELHVWFNLQVIYIRVVNSEFKTEHLMYMRCYFALTLHLVSFDFLSLLSSSVVDLFSNSSYTQVDKIGALISKQ